MQTSITTNVNPEQYFRFVVKGIMAHFPEGKQPRENLSTKVKIKQGLKTLDTKITITKYQYPTKICVKYEMDKQTNVIQYDINKENDLTNIIYSETRYDKKGNETLLASFTEKIYTNKSKKRMEALATYLRAHPEE